MQQESPAQHQQIMQLRILWFAFQLAKGLLCFIAFNLPKESATAPDSFLAL